MIIIGSIAISLAIDFLYSTVPFDQYVLDVMIESLLATLPQPVSEYYTMNN